MRYLLVESENTYWEFPVIEQKKEIRENVWQEIEGKNSFILSDESHFFDRSSDITISSDEEADIRIDGLQVKIYIQEQSVYVDQNEEKHFYVNQKRALKTEFRITQGDVLFLHSVKVIFGKDEVEIIGEPTNYRVKLMEKESQSVPFENFPVYKRSPRLIKRLSAEKVPFELPREKEKPSKKGLIMTVLPPLAMTGVTVAVGLLIGRGIYMLMSVSATGMAVVFSIVKYFNDRQERKEKNETRIQRYTEYLWKKQQELADLYEYEKEVYEYQYPQVKEIASKVKDYDSRIYERVQSDDDFLTISIGHSKGATCFQIDGKAPQWDAEPDDLVETGQMIRKKFAIIDKPKVIDLKHANLGLVGTKEVLHEQLEIFVTQLAFFQSYHDLQIIMVCDEKYAQDFSWMRWLPHMRIQAINALGLVSSERTRDVVLGSMNQILKERCSRLEEGKKETRFLPHYLFIIDEPSLIMDHVIMEYLRMNGNELGFSIIYTSYLRANLPEYIGTILILESSKEGTLLLEEKEYKKQKLELNHAEGVELEWVARNLSVLEHEQGITSHIPKSVTFFEMYGVQHPEELKIRERWRNGQSHKSLAVPLGLRAAGDILSLNLHEKAHGPHGLVAGTTGSGKSETIQSYILSLAVNFHPHEVGFLLIDYKGGGMANMFRDLPHLLGTITNLDGSESMRALASVKAELARRQRVFSTYGVNHINGYMELFKVGEAKEPIPHLFIISDEFAELKKEQPEFMKELVSAARIGRSLGVHLILATQKPTGVVDDQIWSNSKFKLCLKVQNEGDSKEVLKTPDAASITLPGRAYLQVGNNEIYELFQSAWSGAIYIEEKEKDVTLDERIYKVNEIGQGELINQDLSGKKAEKKAVKTQLEVIIEHIKKVYESEKQIPVKKPWLPPLQNMIVSPYAKEEKQTPNKWGWVNLNISIGKMDIPELQSQKECNIDFFKEGNLLFVASSGYGKTLFLTTILMSLAKLNDVDFLNFYILDYGNGGMMSLKALPHTAEYISIDEEERYWKFKKLIMTEMAVRKKLFAKHAVSSLDAYNQIADLPLKAIVIAIDHFDVIKEMGIEEEEFFTKLTRDGVGLGIFTIVTTTRVNSIRQATLNNFKNKIAGYNFDENETFLAVGRSTYKQAEIKGRALIKTNEVHALQIYTMVSCENEISYSRSLKQMIQDIRNVYPNKEAPHIPVLPDELYASMLQEYQGTDVVDYPIGLDVESVTVKGFERGDSPFVVIGNTGTGKTNIIKVILKNAIQIGKTYIFDSKSMELYYATSLDGASYIKDRTQIVDFLKELSEEVNERKEYLHRMIEENPNISPKNLVRNLKNCTIIIDDVDDFIDFIKPELNKVAGLFKECENLGVTLVISVHAAKVRGIDEINKIVKQASNGLVLSSQGVTTIFPLTSMKELPKFGDGLLFKNGTYLRVRLPKYEKEE